MTIKQFRNKYSVTLENGVYSVRNLFSNTFILAVQNQSELGNLREFLNDIVLTYGKGGKQWK